MRRSDERGLTRRLAAWVAAIDRGVDVPPDLLDAARHWLLDTVGCGLHGTTTEWGRIAIELARATPGGAAIFGVEAGAETLHAVLANGIAIHAFDFDEYHPAGKIHASATVFPAALATAQELGASGRDLLRAYVIGIETAVRVALGVNPDAARVRGWHLTGVCGVFGAAAACAWLRRLDATETAWALGSAGSQAAGLWAFNADGAMAKRLHAGHAAHAGHLAAQLAALGFTGPTMILEAEDGGFCRAVSDRPRPELIVAGLDAQEWQARSLALKPYPCCATAHSSIDAAIALHREGLAPSRIRRVRVRQSEVGILQTGWPYRPSTVLAAQMSLRYCVAAALSEGRVTVAQLAPDRIAAPALVELAGRIEPVVDPEIDRVFPASRPSVLEVETIDGARLVKRVDEPLGSPSRPLSDDDVIAKFRAQAAAVLTAEQIASVEDTVMHVEQLAAGDLAASISGRRRPALATPR